MKDPFHFFLGFFEWIIFPFFALFLGSLGFTATRTATLGASLSILAAVYPLGVWVIALYKISGLGPEPRLAQAYLDLARGAQVASYIVLAGSVPFLFIVALAYGQFAVGAGFLLVGLGSIWMPVLFSSSARAKLLAFGSDANKFFESVGGTAYGSEKLASVFLVLMLGKRVLLERLFPAILYLIFLIALYIKGWIMLSSSGAVPASLIGLTAPLIILSRSFFSVRTIPMQEKLLIANKLSEQIPARHLAGGRAGIVFLSILALLIIAYIFRT